MQYTVWWYVSIHQNKSVYVLTLSKSDSKKLRLSMYFQQFLFFQTKRIFDRIDRKTSLSLGSQIDYLFLKEISMH